MHPVFHVYPLKPFTLDYIPLFGELPRPPYLSTAAVLPVAILDCCMRKKGNNQVIQLKIQWFYEVIHLCYHEAMIWDGASSQGAAIVTPT
jgi:hypothetical protein